MFIDSLIFIVFFCILFGFIIYQLKKLNKNKEMFKDLFKFQKPILVKYIFQILLILIFSLLLIFQTAFLGLLAFSMIKDNCGLHVSDIRASYKISFVMLNHVLNLEKKLSGNVSYENANEFGKIIANRRPIVGFYNITDADVKIKDREKSFTNREIKKYNLSEYKNMPVIDVGETIMISKFEPGCKTVDLDNPENSSCIIDVDVNGFKEKPNKKDGFDSKHITNTDRYSFIIDGNEDKVKYPSMYEILIKG